MIITGQWNQTARFYEIQGTVIYSRAILVAVTSECRVQARLEHCQTVQTQIRRRRTRRLIRACTVCLNYWKFRVKWKFLSPRSVTFSQPTLRGNRPTSAVSALIAFGIIKSILENRVPLKPMPGGGRGGGICSPANYNSAIWWVSMNTRLRSYNYYYLSGSFQGQPQQAYNIKMTSYQRQCDVITSHRRWYDVILTLCACWDLDRCYCTVCSGLYVPVLMVIRFTDPDWHMWTGQQEVFRACRGHAWIFNWPTVHAILR